MTRRSPGRRLTSRATALVESPHAVAVAAVAAVLLRLPGLTRPIRPDEAGFLLVARAWHPEPDAMFGTYWVDRPPLLIAVVRACDAVGGPHLLRVVGALACGLLVVIAARVARLVAGRPAAGWTALAVAALTSHPLIDVVAVKGELLALPLVMGSIWCTLLAVRRASPWMALGSGVLGALALGLKQNLVAGLVFAGAVLVLSRLSGRISRRRLAALAGATLAGAAVPVAGTVAWALAAGVDLSAVWYALVGFRTDAVRVITTGTLARPLTRALVLVAVAVGTGLAFLLGGFLARLRGARAADPVVAGATLAVLATDVVGLAAGGAYWRDYLFALVPGAALGTALWAGLGTGHAAGREPGREPRRGRGVRLAVAGTVASCLGFLGGWLAYNLAGLQEFDEVRTGEAVAAAARPGDTLVVFGGRADVQLASGLPSPYRFLWSLPMRTLDPRYAELRRLLGGAEAPTWFVGWVPFGSWGNPAGQELRQTVHARYEVHGTGCGGHAIYLLRGVDRPEPEPDCGHGGDARVPGRNGTDPPGSTRAGRW